MSLRCSLLGHSYGEAEIEREREEQGSEVVVTVREFEECARCGDQNVLTENKEVTAIESPAPDLESAEDDPDVGPGPDATTDASGTGNASGSTGTSSTGTSGVSDSTGPDVSAEDDGAEIMTDDGGSGGAAGGGASARTGGSTDAARATGGPDSTAAGSSGVESASASTASDVEAGPSAADDDGVILDDEESTAGDDDRQPGEWPEAETTHPAEAEESGHADWPDVGRADEGFDAEPSGGSADVEFNGLTPESAGEVDEDEEVEFVNADGDTLDARDTGTSRSDLSSDLSSGISAGAEAPNLAGPAGDPDVDAEFVCPECDYREPVAGSSLRAGDICPECSRGYLATE